MKKITKKEFINILCSKQNYLIYSPFLKRDYKQEIENYCTNTAINQSAEFRTVLKHSDTKITFSNDSVIAFNQNGKKEFFKMNDYLIFKTEYFDEFDQKFNYQYLVYGLK